METLRSSAISSTGNGPVDDPDVGGGEEELAKAMKEKDKLKEQVKELEKKLDDLKLKNNVSSLSIVLPQYYIDIIIITT